MKLLRLKSKDGRTVLIPSAALAAVYEGASNRDSVCWVRTVGCSDDGEFCVRESPDQIAAMLAEETPNSALEAAAPEMLEALRAAHTSLQLAYKASKYDDSNTIRMIGRAIAKAEGRA